MLARKISRGKLVEEAAAEAGIPLEEAQKWLEERRKSKVYDEDSLRLLSAQALYAGMQALIRHSRNHDGRVKVEGGEFGQTYQFDDVDAAKALVAAGIKIRTMLGAGKGKPTPGEVIDDLFDRASNWNFPEAK